MATNTAQFTTDDVQSYALQEGMELRFDTETKDVFIELISGSAEIFGCKLCTSKKYKISPNCKLAVFTWYGCTLNVHGKFENAYISENNVMMIYINLHCRLDEWRERALQENGRGPRILVTGPLGIGKSTLCKILANYAYREHWCPMLVDINPENNDISLPGTLACLPIREPIDVEGNLNIDESLIFHYGHTSAEVNVNLYDKIVQKLAVYINTKSETIERGKASGVIINACGWNQKEGYQRLLNAIKAFEVNMVLVLEHELLYKNLNEEFAEGTKILLLPKPGGVFGVAERKENARHSMVRNYFYGIRNNIFPHVFEVKFGDIQVYKTVANKGKDVLLPLGMQGVCDNVVPVQISNSLRYHVLSISCAVSRTHDDIARNNIVGFVVVNNVDIQKQAVTLLSPQPRQEFRYNVMLLIDGLTFQDA